MRKNRLPFTWQTATTFAVCCFLGGIGVAVGVHESRVGVAVEQAREEARTLSEEREKLESTLDKAREVSLDSEAVSDEASVAAAAAELTQAATTAAYAAEKHHITVSATAVVAPSYINEPLAAETLYGPYAVAPTLKVDAAAVLGDLEGGDSPGDADDDTGSTEAATTPSAEPTEPTEPTEPADESSGTPSATPSAESSDDADAAPSADASDDEPSAEDEAAALAEIMQETEVAQVLRGEIDDLATVTATVDRLEDAAAQLDAATRRIEGTTAVLEAAAADAALERANLSLDEQLEAIKGLSSSSKAMVEAVDGNVADDATITAVKKARTALVDLRDTDLDREDGAAVDAFAADVVAATDTLAAAEQDLYDSHQAWVKQENKRRDKENAKRQKAYDKQVDAAYATLRSSYATYAAARQEGWSGTPDGVSYANGYVPSSQLCSLSFASGHMLQCDAARALEAADDAYHAQTGSHLNVSSSYRSYGAQVATKASKGYLAATPGQSNHGWGMAVDLDGASASWLRANGEQYGWVHPLWARPGGSKPESWHLEFVAPDASVSLPDEPNMLAHVKSSLKG